MRHEGWLVCCLVTMTCLRCARPAVLWLLGGLIALWSVPCRFQQSCALHSQRVQQPASPHVASHSTTEQPALKAAHAHRCYPHTSTRTPRPRRAGGRTLPTSSTSSTSTPRSPPPATMSAFTSIRQSRTQCGAMHTAAAAARSSALRSPLTVVRTPICMLCCCCPAAVLVAGCCALCAA